MKKTILATVVSSLLSAQSLYAMTLDDAVETALRTNPEVLAAAANSAAAEQEKNRVAAGFKPTIDASLAAGHEISDNPTTRATGKDSVDLVRKEASVILTQKLFDGYETKSQVSKRHAELEATGHASDVVKEDVAFRAAQAYLEVLRHTALARLSEDNLKVHHQILRQIRKKSDHGAGRKSEQRQAEARLALARASKSSAVGNLKNARATFERVVGQAPDALSLPPIVTQLLPKDIETIEDLAVSVTPAVEEAASRVDAAKADSSSVDAAFSPRLDFELKASANDDVDGVKGVNRDVSAMLKLRYNLYRGGADEARQALALQSVVREEENLNRIRRASEEAARQAWNGLMTARERVVYLRDHAEISHEVLKAYKEQFKIGRRTLLDVLDSQNELFNAQASYVTGQYKVREEAYRVLSSLGQLREALNQK